MNSNILTKIDCQSALFFLVVLAGCDEGAFRSQAEVRRLALVDGRAVTAAELAVRIAGLPEGQRPRDATTTEALLRELVDLEVLAAEARRRSFDSSHEARAAIVAALGELELLNIAKNLPTPEALGFEEVERYHREHLSDYVTPELRRLAVAFFPSRELAVVARRTPLGRVQELGSVPPPSTDPSPAGGDPNATVPRVFVKAVFALANVGEISEPVEYEGRFWLVAFLGRSAPHTRTLANEERNIRRKLVEQRFVAARARFLDEARKSTAIHIDEETLKLVRVVGDANAYDPAQWKRR